MTEDNLDNVALQDIDDYYSRLRWNNQFRYMAKLPTHLQDLINKKLSTNHQWDQSLLQTDDNLIDYQHSKSLVKGYSMVNQNNIDNPLERYKVLLSQKPQWHRPWKLVKIINGHLGWVRCIAMEPIQNEWFVTGSNDTTLKVWDLSTGHLKLTLSGHVMAVRDVCVSRRHPYMFSASDDKLAKCWDLEKNAVIRDYYGHLSGVHTVDIHPTLDVIVTAGRDSVVKLWDIRSRKAIVTLVGHKAPIQKVKCLPVDPQVISCSNDATIRLWDIVAGKSMKVISHHKRAVRSIAIHPTEFSMASACSNDIRSWKLSEGDLLTNFSSESLGIINSLSVNEDNVLFAGGDNGVLSFFDYKSGHLYQSIQTVKMAGSLDSEKGILTSCFDQTGLRLLTGEVDKSIKIWKQDEDATPETHPGMPWNPILASQRF